MKEVKSNKLKFFDTNAVITLGNLIQDEELFIISSKTLEEIEHIKNSHNKDEQVKYQARIVSRLLKKIKNYYCVIVNNSHVSDIQNRGLEVSPDNIIIACYIDYIQQNNHLDVCFITDDINAYNIAKHAWGINNVECLEENYNLYTGIKYIELDENEEIEDAINNKVKLTELIQNEYILIGNWYYNEEYDQEQFLSRKSLRYKNGYLVDAIRPKMKDLNDLFDYNYEQQLVSDAINDENIDIIAIYGDAGTGKDFVTFCNSIWNVKQNIKQASKSKNRNSKIDSILYTRNNIEAGERLGFLKGDMNDKTAPYNSPARQNINKILKRMYSDGENFESMLDKKQYLEYPHQFIRGCTFDNYYMIFDECANASVEDLHTFISRAGENSKVILIGSFNQIDKKGNTPTNNGLYEIIKKYTGQDNFACIKLVNQQRSYLARQADKLLS